MSDTEKIKIHRIGDGDGGHDGGGAKVCERLLPDTLIKRLL